MTSKLTQHEAIVLHLAQRPGEWYPSYDLEKATLSGQWVGTRGSRSARDLAQWGKLQIKGMTYFVERRQVGKYAEFRVAFTKEKPKQQIEYLPDNTVRVTYGPQA